MRQAVQEGRLQVLRRGSDNGGGRRKAAHEHPLQELLQLEASRKKRTRGESQAMEDLGRRKRAPEANCRLAWGSKGFSSKMWERYPAKWMYAENLLSDAPTALQLLHREGQALLRESER